VEEPVPIDAAEPLVLPDADAPRVSILVPSAAKPGLLLACLRSLSRNAPRGIPFETIVVLNRDDGERSSRVRSAATGVRVIASRANLGLAGAGNRARREARGELLVLLHDDAEVEPGWLEALVETADRHPEAGAVGGKVLNPDGSLQNAGMILWRDATTSDAWTGPVPPPDAFGRLRAVDYCGTSSLLVRAASWDAAGGLEERFYPAYYVDVGLAMAIRRNGQVVLYQPASRIRHHRGASMETGFRHWVGARNRRLFLSLWEKELEEQEPFVAGSAEAIARALSRAERAAATIRARGAARASGPPRLVNVAEQERRHLAMEAGLKRAFARDAFKRRVLAGLEAWHLDGLARPVWKLVRRFLCR
jgi:GT2 family glycosyltransferase